MTRSPAGWALILYDWEGDISQSAWLDVAFSFFDQVGRKPNSASYIRKKKISKLTKPSNLRRSLEGGPFDACELHRRLPPYDDALLFDLYAGFFIGQTRKKQTAFAYQADDLDASLFVGLVQDLSSTIGITYGHVISYPTVTGCAMYAAGLNHQSIDGGGETPGQRHLWMLERADLILQKKLAPFRHLDGMLRDVYSFNVLTAPHVHRLVDGIEFDSWISHSGSRGNLEQITEQVWIWVVPASDIEIVRFDLQNAGMLITRPSA